MVEGWPRARSPSPKGSRPIGARAAMLGATPASSGRPPMMDAEQLAQFFHETYARLAPEYGRKMHSVPSKPWAEVREPHKSLLIAVAREILFTLYGENFVKWQEQSAKEYKKYLIDCEHQAAEQIRICACGHAVSEHIPLAAPDSTPYLICTAPTDGKYVCGDIRLPGWHFSRCSIPTEVVN